MKTKDFASRMNDIVAEELENALTALGYPFPQTDIITVEDMSEARSAVENEFEFNFGFNEPTMYGTDDELRGTVADWIADVADERFNVYDECDIEDIDAGRGAYVVAD